MASWKASLLEKLAVLKISLASHIGNFPDRLSEASRRLQSHQNLYICNRSLVSLQATDRLSSLRSTWSFSVVFRWTFCIEHQISKSSLRGSRQIAHLSCWELGWNKLPSQIILYEGLLKPFYFVNSLQEKIFPQLCSIPSPRDSTMQYVQFPCAKSFCEIKKKKIRLQVSRWWQSKLKWHVVFLRGQFVSR